MPHNCVYVYTSFIIRARCTCSLGIYCTSTCTCRSTCTCTCSDVDLHVHVDQRVWVDLHVRTYIIMHVRCSDTVDLPVHVHYIEFIYTCVMNIHVHIFRRSRCTCTCGRFTIQIDAKSFIWRKQLFFYISTFMLHVILNAKNAYNMVLTRKPKITGFFISTVYKQ